MTFPEFAKDYPLAMQDNWKKVCVDATLQPMEFAAIFAPLYLSGKFEAFAFQMPIGTYPDPSCPLAGYFGSALNRNNTGNPKVDALIKQAANTGNEAQRKQAYADLIEQLAQDAPHIWPVMPNDIWVASAKVKLPKPTWHSCCSSTSRTGRGQANRADRTRAAHYWMVRYLLRRAVEAVPVLLGISLSAS